MTRERRQQLRVPRLLLAAFALAAALLAAVDVLGHAEPASAHDTAVASAIASAADAAGVCHRSCVLATPTSPQDAALGCLAILGAFTLVIVLLLARHRFPPGPLSLAGRTAGQLTTRAPPRVGLVLAVQAVSRT